MVGLLPSVNIQRLQFFYNVFPSVKPVYTLNDILKFEYCLRTAIDRNRFSYIELLNTTLFIQLAILVEYADKRQAMSSATVIVILIVSRGDLYNASSKLHINQLWITNNWNLLLGNRMDDAFSVKALSACIS
jgi:hypothetical protein